jgi:hypothetical protein
MAQAHIKKYLTMKPEVNKIFEDLEKYHDFCRFELREFDPAHLYDKGNFNYRAFLDSTRSRGPRKPWQNRERREYTQ